MFYIRPVKKVDLEGLYRLSLLENFLNLPQNKKLLELKIQKSENSFQNLKTFNQENSFLFVLIDEKEDQVIGCSNLHAKHGTQEKPHYYLKVGKEVKQSTKQSLSFNHVTLKLGIEEDGYTEIGGLVLDPKYRGHKYKLGKQISYTRFLFIAMYPHLFTEVIHTELLPPFNKDGSSPLWSGLGEKFFEMNYMEADILSRKDKSFILDLFPIETIYAKLLDEKARLSIGKVGESTKPVQRMLEKIGFEYTQEVDPFDGGPHYRCEKTQILPIKNSFNGPISVNTNINSRFYLCAPMGASEFECRLVEGSFDKEKFEAIENPFQNTNQDQTKFKFTAL